MNINGASAPHDTDSRAPWVSGPALAGYVAAFRLTLYLLCGQDYSYFRDEFYYLACAEHLAWGYVDHPPLSIFLLAGTRALLGDGLYALRLLPALASAGVILVAAALAREMGGGRYAQFIAALLALITPPYLFMGNYYSMNMFDALFWALGAWVIARIVNTGDSRLWLLFGVICGLALLNKISILFFGFGVAAGLVLTPHRQFIASKWLWLGGLAALLIFLPHLIWQALNGAPTLEWMANAREFKNTEWAPLAFLGAQFLMGHPVGFTIALIGLAYLLFSKTGGQYRIFAWIFLTILTFFLIQGAKTYYLSPAYPMLFAAGALALERGLERPRLGWLRPVIAVIVILTGAITAPLTLPLLPPETLVSYLTTLGLRAPQDERHTQGALDQHFADQFGWEHQVERIAALYHSLSEDDRKVCAIFAGNYGEAGAIDLFGPRHGLPKALCGHNSYWTWGPGDGPYEVFIVLGVGEDRLRRFFHEVTLVERIGSDYAVPYEADAPLWLCRQPKANIRAAWPELKMFI